LIFKKKTAVGSWQLAVSSWQLAVGSWQLAVGSWQLAVGSWQFSGSHGPEIVKALLEPSRIGEIPLSNRRERREKPTEIQ
jgi:hypothetical protein